ncbi:MAG TPA: hypothetical protein VHN56_01870 [Actinomycetota bacterium]|jgi:hypothetical protein|nr:hypothetical protein [Actinomycetota bacterium]
MPSKSPQERSIISTLGAHSLHANPKYDDRQLTKNARAASPGADGYWEKQVDPDGLLDPAERARRAGHAKKPHFLSLALKSAQARRKKVQT